MGSEKKVFTSAQVSLHNTINDCWVTINARVYEVTNFLDDHPGGDEILLAAAGKDASQEFEEAGHGSAARLMLDEFYVGEIGHSNSITTRKMHPKQHTTTTPPPPSRNKEANYKSSVFFLVVVVVLVPLTILGFVVSNWLVQ